MLPLPFRCNIRTVDSGFRNQPNDLIILRAFLKEKILTTAGMFVWTHLAASSPFAPSYSSQSFLTSAGRLLAGLQHDSVINRFDPCVM